MQTAVDLPYSMRVYTRYIHLNLHSLYFTMASIPCKKSLFSDIRNSFTDIQNSFTDIQNSTDFLILENELLISEIIYRYP